MSDSEVPATPQGVPATSSEVKFTEKEERVLKAVWACMKTLPEVDMAKLSHAAGFQTLKTCQNTWGQIKKKLMAQAVANGIEVMSPAKPPKTPASTPKKRAKPAAAEESTEEEDDATPTKAKKPRKAKREAIKEEDEETSQSEGGESTKKEEDVQMDDGAVFGAA